MRNHVQLADAYYRLSDEERKYGESASITEYWSLIPCGEGFDRKNDDSIDAFVKKYDLRNHHA